ncbi:hypothetical protein [Jannaschia sp. 2305UL9-9]|uniref:hypothetical protein n=1 Tax=Jannaschia sp. 2305UL9-9 TaxID=3121638 RepID=UPI003528F87B
MSLISTIQPLSPVTKTQRDAPNLSPPPADRPAPPSPASGGSAVGGLAPAELSLARMAIPPVMASRGTNATSDTRPGAEGRNGAAPDTSQDARETTEEERRAAAAERGLIQKELMSRIPVPVDAIPKLTGDLETLRQMDAKDTERTVGLATADREA